MGAKINITKSVDKSSAWCYNRKEQPLTTLRFLNIYKTELAGACFFNRMSTWFCE